MINKMPLDLETLKMDLARALDNASNDRVTPRQLSAQYIEALESKVLQLMNMVADQIDRHHHDNEFMSKCIQSELEFQKQLLGWL